MCSLLAPFLGVITIGGPFYQYVFGIFKIVSCRSHCWILEGCTGSCGTGSCAAAVVVGSDNGCNRVVACSATNIMPRLRCRCLTALLYSVSGVLSPYPANYSLHSTSPRDYMLNPIYPYTIVIFHFQTRNINFHHNTNPPLPILALLIARTISSVTSLIFSSKNCIFQPYAIHII
jgi:hypothetical protein